MMLNWKRSSAAIAALLLLTLTFSLDSPAFAKGKKGRGNNGRGNRSNPTTVIPNSAVQLLNLSSRQKNLLVDLIQGTGSLNDLLDNQLRVDLANLSPLPPGIRRQVQEGKGLPPGIAKKVLPNSVTQYLGLPDGVSVAFLGTDVVILSPENIVLDFIQGLF